MAFGRDALVKDDHPLYLTVEQLVKKTVEEVPQVVYTINKGNGFQVVAIPISQAAIRTLLESILAGKSVAELQAYCRTLLDKQGEMHRSLWQQWNNADEEGRKGISTELQGCALYRIILHVFANNLSTLAQK